MTSNVLEGILLDSVLSAVGYIKDLSRRYIACRPDVNSAYVDRNGLCATISQPGSMIFRRQQ